MADDKKKSNIILDFFKKAGVKAKVIFAAIGAAIGFIFIIIFNRKVNEVKMLQYELKKVRHEIEIEKASEAIEENNDRLSELKAHEEEIKKKIWEIDNRAPSGDVTPEELDRFFDDRGF